MGDDIVKRIQRCRADVQFMREILQKYSITYPFLAQESGLKKHVVNKVLQGSDDRYFLTDEAERRIRVLLTTLANVLTERASSMLDDAERINQKINPLAL